MARLVILQFDDMEDLAMFYNFHEDIGHQGVQIGEYYLPGERIYCRCKGKRNASDWRRHRKFGLWICRQCGRPSQHWLQGLQVRLTEALGTNLMK